MSSDVAVLAEDLTKFYGPQRGIEGLSLQVQAGEVMGFLGPNGTGKTTTIRLLPRRTPGQADGRAARRVDGPLASPRTPRADEAGPRRCHLFR